MHSTLLFPVKTGFQNKQAKKRLKHKSIFSTNLGLGSSVVMRGENRRIREFLPN